MDYSKVNERIYTGSAINNIQDVEELIKIGVTHVIDARSDFNDAPIIKSKLSYVWNPTEDDGQHKPVEWFEKAINFALLALLRPGNVVYCHCFAGVNRGPSLTYAILRVTGYSADDAMTQIKKNRAFAGVCYWRDAEEALVKLGWTKAVEEVSNQLLVRQAG